MNRIITTVASVSLAMAGLVLNGCQMMGKGSTPVTKASNASSDPTGGFSDAGIRERAGISRNYAIAGMDDATAATTSQPATPTTTSTDAETLARPPKATTTEPADLPAAARNPAEQEPVVTPEPEKMKPEDTAPANPDDAAATKPDDTAPVKPDDAAPVKPDDTAKPDASTKPDDAAAPPATDPASNPSDTPAPPPAEENK